MGSRPDSLSRLKDRVLGLVEGTECPADHLPGWTESGVAVCMTKDCIRALADAIVVEDYATAEADISGEDDVHEDDGSVCQ